MNSLRHRLPAPPALLLMLALMMLALAAPPAAAAPDCRSGDKATREIVLCDEALFEAARKRLDDAYAGFARGLDAYGAGLLSKAQEVWLQFRDANCEAAADPSRGGTAWAVLEVECRTAMTEARARELAGQAKNAAPKNADR